MGKWLSDNFDSIANWCSILGFLVSIYVMYSLNRIRKHYEYKARIPEIVSQLDEFSKNLNSYFDDIPANKNDIILTIKRLEYTLISLRQKQSNELIKSINLLLQRTNRIKRGGSVKFLFFKNETWSFEDESWEIYSDIQGILQGVKEDSRDSSWREQ